MASWTWIGVHGVDDSVRRCPRHLSCVLSPAAQVKVSWSTRYHPIAEATLAESLNGCRLNRICMISPEQLQHVLAAFEQHGTLDQSHASMTLGAHDVVIETPVATSQPQLELTDHEKAWLLAEGMANTMLEDDPPAPSSVPNNNQVGGWSVSQVGAFMRSTCLAEFASQFETEEIDGECLLMMDTPDLVELGMPAFGHQRLLLLHSQQPDQAAKLRTQLQGTKMRGHELSVSMLVSELNTRNLPEAAGACERHRVCVLVLLSMTAQEIRDQLRLTSLSETLGFRQLIQELSGDHSAQSTIADASVLLFVEDGDVPEQFLCPIKCDVMEDPCTASDGHVYERYYIEQWLQNHSTSPMTNEPLPNKRLVTNKALKKQIAQFRQNSA